MFQQQIEGLINSGAIDELMKSEQGRSIVERIKSLKRELETLPDLQQKKFNDDFGDRMVKTLENLVHKNGSNQEFRQPAGINSSDVIVLLAVVVILITIGILICLKNSRKPIRKTRHRR